MVGELKAQNDKHFRFVFYGQGKRHPLNDTIIELDHHQTHTHTQASH